MPRTQSMPSSAQPDLDPTMGEDLFLADSADQTGDPRQGDAIADNIVGGAVAGAAPAPAEIGADGDDEPVPPDYVADYADDQSAGVIDDGVDQRVPFF